MQWLRLFRASGIQNQFNRFTMFHMKRKRNPESLMILLLHLANRIQVLQSCVTVVENPIARSMNLSARCKECQMIGHFERWCKRLCNFPNNHSYRQNQSSSTGSGRMNVVTAVPQLDAEFLDERGFPKVYNLPPAPQIGIMNILKKIPQNDAILISERGEEIQLI